MLDGSDLGFVRSVNAVLCAFEDVLWWDAIEGQWMNRNGLVTEEAVAEKMAQIADNMGLRELGDRWRSTARRGALIGALKVEQS